MSQATFVDKSTADSMDRRPSNCLHHKPRVAEPDPRCCCRVAEMLEVAVCCLCSFVTWEYTVQNELPRRHDGDHGLLGQHGAGTDASDFFFRPPPGLMLFSCLVFGCCVSSFTHRRQSEDPFQLVVYVVLLGAAATIGYGVQAHAHLILLGYLPWATCAAMVVSISGHGLYRWLKPGGRPSHRDEEKAHLLG